MREKAMRRAATRAHGLDARCVCGRAVRLRPLGPQQPLNHDRDHAVERLWPADGVHGWDGSAGLVRPSTVLWSRARSRWRSTRGTHPRRRTLSQRCWDGGQRPVAGLVRLTGVPDGARMGYQITRPAGDHDQPGVYDDSQLQNIANGRGWIGFTYWNGGTAPVHPNGTAVDAAASGPRWTYLNTPYWGIELRCVQSVCSWPG